MTIKVFETDTWEKIAERKRVESYDISFKYEDDILKTNIAITEAWNKYGGMLTFYGHNIALEITQDEENE